MAQKHVSTESTLIFQGDSSLDSLMISRIQSPGLDHFAKRISSSLQNFKNPFQQTLPLKFPKRRLRAEGISHILAQSDIIKHKACIKTSELRNKQFQQKPWRKERGQGEYKKNQFESSAKFIRDLDMNSKSLQNKQSQSLSSPFHRQRKHFHHKISAQNLISPILLGHEHKIEQNTMYHKLAEQPLVKRHRGQDFSKNLEWDLNKSGSKQKFHNSCNAKPLQARNFIKIVDKNEKQRKTQSMRGSRVSERPKTYKDLYNSRKRAIQ